MTKDQLSGPREVLFAILRFLLCFSLLRTSSTTTTASYFNFDLSTTTLVPTTMGFTITGSAPSNQLGYAVSTAGDINKDGYDDIIFGAHGTTEGTAYVIYGGKTSSFVDFDFSTPALDPLTTGFKITGDDPGNQLGYSVSAAGDVDNDGYDDIIVGAVSNNLLKGAAYVIYGGEKSSLPNRNLGSFTLNPLTTGFKITGGATSDNFGWSVSTAGDINKDGFDDIIIGAKGFSNSKGAAYVIYGGPKSSMQNIDFSSGTTLNPSTTGFKITGGADNDQLGYSVSTAGDINNDGYDDIIVGARGKRSGSGAAYVIYGGPKSSMQNIDFSSGDTLDRLTNGFTMIGPLGSSQFGKSATTAGDINKDGYDDMIVGAYDWTSAKGVVFVIYGGHKFSMSDYDFSTDVLDPQTTGFVITGNAANDLLGWSVSAAGDLNKDGYSDIIVGAWGQNTNRGTAFAIYGGPKSSRQNINFGSGTTLNPLTNGFTIKGNAANDQLGVSVSTAGDINGDGFKDIIIGANGRSSSRGAVYVIHAACSQCWDCPANCDECKSSRTSCTECDNPYFLYQSQQCLTNCPGTTFGSSGKCEACPANCYSCTSGSSCQICYQGYSLSDSLCVLSTSQEDQEKASQAVSSATQAVGGLVCIGSTMFPVTALVSTIVQNTRYLNLSVTTNLAEIYQSWDTNIISWDVPNVISNFDHFKASPALFSRYGIESSFLTNFWPTLVNIGIGFTAFVTCFVFKKLFEEMKYEGWISSVIRKLLAGSFNFTLIQAYACLDSILFYLVIDIKTNPFNSFFSWVSVISASVFLVLGCLLVFFNFWTVKKYQDVKSQGRGAVEAFNERNKYWELFYSDFRDDDLLSQSFFAFLIMRSTFSSLIITVLYDYPLMQTSFLVVLDGVIILLLVFKKPFTTLRGTLCQYYFEIITLLVHLSTFILPLQDSFETSSETLKKILSTGIIYLNTALISGSIGFMFIEIYKTISEKRKSRHHLEQKKYENIAIQTASEDILETPTVSFKTEAQRKLETWVNKNEQATSFENLHLLSSFGNNSSMSRLHLETSQARGFNLNTEDSFLPDPSDRINQSKELSPTPAFIRPLPRSLKQNPQKRRLMMPDNKIHPAHFVNN